MSVGDLHLRVDEAKPSALASLVFFFHVGKSSILFS